MVVNNNDIIAKTSGQGVLSPLPSSGGVRYRDTRHEDILQCSVMDNLGHGPLVSFHFPCHGIKGVYSNCVIMYTTLFVTYIVYGIKAMIHPGTSASKGLHLLLSLMSAGLAGLRCGSITCFFFNHNALVYRSAARFTTLYIRGEAATLTSRLFMNVRGNAER